jgi:hypothetical protein
LRTVDGRLVGIHRTFLRKDGGGKADVERPKLMLGRARAAAVRFGEGPEIVLTEGIENALSVRQAISLPTWAAGSLSGLLTIALPPGVRRVTVFADAKPHERSGAEEAGRRLVQQGRDVRVAYPPDGRDANDLLKST